MKRLSDRVNRRSRTRKSNNNTKDDSLTITLKNLPFTVSRKELKTYFREYGVICNVDVEKRDGRKTGQARVTFLDLHSAQNAAKKGSGLILMGRKVEVVWKNPQLNNGNKHEAEVKVKGTEGPRESEKVKPKVEPTDGSIEEGIRELSSKVSHPSKSYNQYSKECKRGKRGRIIVRNISFKASEEKLLEHFKEFGPIIDVKLLKKEDGKLVGCGFIQFQKKQHAIQAILKRSGKPFLGRPIVCDWALSKDRFMKQMDAEIKSENEPTENIKVKEEPLSEESDVEEVIKTEKDMKSEENSDTYYSDVEKVHVKEENTHEFESEDNVSDDEEMEGDDESGEDLDSVEDDEREEEPEVKRPRVISNDVTEGCTVFIKNIPFTATNDDLAECLKTFGPLEYALICVDKVTEHSRGTGFAKFKEKEDADKCLEESANLLIKDQKVVVMKALPRNEIKTLAERKKEKMGKDNRHLYLVKEGVILAGTPAAKGVSVADMEKRLKIEQWKTQMLRNLNMFVSNTRLIIYNLPLSWTDNHVRELFKRHGGPGAMIKEARVMRNLRDCDASGVGKSKGYAFVRFTEHQHALNALRNLNNNPNIFGPSKRPIICFSIENKAVLNIKMKRLQKSLQMNAEKRLAESTGNHHSQNGQQANAKKSSFASGSLKRKRNGGNNFRNNVKPHSENSVNNYSGLEGMPGSKKMRTKFSLRTEAYTHQKNVKKEKSKQKAKFKRNMNKKFREPQMPQKRRNNEDHFNKLENKYKHAIKEASSRKRWYE